MLGRDLTGKGYLRLDFFNLFWIFSVCCILGLVLEIVWRMIVVDPGHYENRAGLLFGPFSPIYGFGTVLVTLALNRLYKNPIATFFISAVVGGGFERATALFMKASFGVTAWDYSDYVIFGMPDPVAVAVLMVANGLMTLGSLDCWFERISGVEPSTPIERFYAENFDNDYTQNRFQTMTMNTTDSTRLDTAVETSSEALAQM